MQSLGGIAQLSYNLAGEYSYELIFDVLRRLSALDDASAEELFRRMVFNVSRATTTTM